MAGRISELKPLPSMDGSELLEVSKSIDGKFKSFNLELSKLSPNLVLYTTPIIPVDLTGNAQLPKKPLGALVFNQAVIYLNDGTVADVDDVVVTEVSGVSYATLDYNDYQQLKDKIVGLVVSYMTSM